MAGHTPNDPFLSERLALETLLRLSPEASINLRSFSPDSPHHVATTPANVLGILSLVFWSLTLVISVKYISFILRADNRGEGGVLALLALVQQRMHRKVDRAGFPG